MGDLIVDFDVPEHFVLAETFISTARATDDVLNALNREYFNGKLDCILVVEAPESGSLRAVLKVFVKSPKWILRTSAGVYGLFWSFVQLMETDIMKQVVFDDTGKLPATIASEKYQKLKSRLTEVRSEEDLSVSERRELEVLCFELADGLAVATAGVMYSSPEKLDKLDLSSDAKYHVKRAQSDLFSSLINEQQISGVCFETKEGTFPNVPRNQFVHRAAAPEKPKDDPDEKWIVQQLPIVVTALAFKKTDAKSGRWRGLTPKNKEIEFTIEDEGFWKLVHSRNASFADGTVLTVQMAARYENDRLKERKVVRVLEFDGNEIAKPLADDALDALLGEWSAYIATDDRQQDMGF
jgi:hypothetical protein